MTPGTSGPCRPILPRWDGNRLRIRQDYLFWEVPEGSERLLRKVCALEAPALPESGPLFLRLIDSNWKQQIATNRPLHVKRSQGHSNEIVVTDQSR